MKRSLLAMSLSVSVAPVARAQLHTGLFPFSLSINSGETTFGPFDTVVALSSYKNNGVVYHEMYLADSPSTREAGMRVYPSDTFTASFSGSTYLEVFQCVHSGGFCTLPTPIVPTGERFWFAFAHEGPGETYHGYVQVRFAGSTTPNFKLEGYRFQENPSIPVVVELLEGCYADCDTSSGAGVLDIFDFLCFQDSFVNADPYACDCYASNGPAVCDIFDFLCFQEAFVVGCP